LVKRVSSTSWTLRDIGLKFCVAPGRMPPRRVWIDYLSLHRANPCEIDTTSNRLAFDISRYKFIPNV
jgi:hypothetical protein